MWIKISIPFLKYHVFNSNNISAKMSKAWFKWAIFLYNYSGSEAGNVGGSMLPVSLPSINNPGHRYTASQQGSQTDR